MSIVTMPASLPIAGANWGQARYDMVEASDSTGVQATRLLGPPRWTLSMHSSEVLPLSMAGKWEAIVYGLRGRVNHLAAFNPGRATPAGTLAGAPRTGTVLAAGATSMTLYGGTNGTLLTGDMLQIGTGLGTSQLVKVMADAAANGGSGAFVWDNTGAFVWSNGGTFVWSNGGAVTVTFEPPLRQAYAQESAVTWDHPIAYFKARSPNSGGAFIPGRAGEGGYSLDLLEAFN